MKILLVEDDERIAEALAEDLTDQHYVVDVAGDGEAAWELVEVFAYDLLLLDGMLPKLSGIGLCQRLRSSGYRMPILLVTGRDTSEDKAIGLAAGADDYLVKPFNLQELTTRIQALLHQGTTSPPILQQGA